LAATVLASAPAAGQTSTAAWTQKTAWGDPDLQGTWRFLQTIPLVRGEEFQGREFLTEEEWNAKVKEAKERNAHLFAGTAERRGFRELPLYDAQFRAVVDPSLPSKRTAAIVDPPDGRLPLWTPQAVKMYEGRIAASKGRGEADWVIDRSIWERCIATVDPPKLGNWGLGYSGRGKVDWSKSHGTEQARTDVCSVGQSTTTGSASAGPGGTAGARPVRRILQSPGYVVIAYEEAGYYRVIPLDNRLKPKFRQWLGVDRGRWEGDTLVVETTNIKYEYPVLTTYGDQIYPGTGETLRVIERYTRVNPDTIQFSYTIEDPQIYARPYTVQLEITRDDGFQMSPWLCHENNGDLAGILSAARADEFAAIQFAAESARARQPRFEEVKKEVEEAAKQGQSR
jgi:hypothetical protein